MNTKTLKEIICEFKIDCLNLYQNARLRRFTIDRSYDINTIKLFQVIYFRILRYLPTELLDKEIVSINESLTDDENKIIRSISDDVINWTFREINFCRNPKDIFEITGLQRDYIKSERLKLEMKINAL